jgi:hypothetical protein
MVPSWRRPLHQYPWYPIWHPPMTTWRINTLSRSFTIWTKPSNRDHPDSSYIPFDILKKEIFDQFLVLLYCGTTTLNHLTRNDWVDIKRLCINWYLPHQTAMIIQRLCKIQIQQLSPQNRYFFEAFTFQHINCWQYQMWRYHQNIVNESIPEDMVIVEDNWSLDRG